MCHNEPWSQVTLIYQRLGQSVILQVNEAPRVSEHNVTSLRNKNLVLPKKMRGTCSPESWDPNGFIRLRSNPCHQVLINEVAASPLYVTVPRVAIMVSQIRVYREHTYLYFTPYQVIHLN